MEATLKDFLFLLFLMIFSGMPCFGGITSTYVRKTEASMDMPMDSDVFSIPQGYNAPQQVHITQGDHVGRRVIVSWVTTSEPGSNTVLYGTEQSKYKYSAEGIVASYKYSNYTSGYIHHCTVKNLQYDTEYFYKIGLGNTTREFSFFTPPRIGLDTPYTFGIIGDLGQTFDSNRTFQHYLKTNGQAVLYVGDLSYADNYPLHDNRRWDSWGQFIEKSAAYQPWIWTAGNHDIDFAPEIGEIQPFKPYMHRYHVPYRYSESTAPLWYSIKRASAYIIVLSSYSAYGKYTPQYEWLKEELPKVNRSETPWLIVLMHGPWYSSNSYHYMEGETMRVQFELWFTQYRVDIVFAGHVHAYERSKRVSNVAYNITNGECTPVFNSSSPVYITIGDGGNIEGLASVYTEPQPEYSAYREASFGHAILDLKNRTHAYYYWHRNQDGDAVVGDSQWFYNRYWYPQREPTSEI
ncbi:purple acid phosphatase 2 [Cryptomeria japonica]|uniref:purple acid phosphatase 2 n=1 Tax=Cryptomeria japonica TaxID=3369 RepID=UPI0027DAA626|nr:purple acid phosphatase 2 [Cryptomeria japonica]